MILEMTNISWYDQNIPDDISLPKIAQAVYMLRKIRGQEDLRGPFREPGLIR